MLLKIIFFFYRQIKTIKLNYIQLFLITNGVLVVFISRPLMC